MLITILEKGFLIYKMVCPWRWWTVWTTSHLTQRRWVSSWSFQGSVARHEVGSWPSWESQASWNSLKMLKRTGQDLYRIDSKANLHRIVLVVWSQKMMIIEAFTSFDSDFVACSWFCSMKNPTMESRDWFCKETLGPWPWGLFQN